MEAVGAVASLLAIIEITAHVIRTSSEYIRGVKDATRAAQRFRQELRDFRTILEQLEERADAERTFGGDHAETKFFLSIQDSLDDCKLIVAKVEKRLTIPTEVVRLKRALMWPFREKEVEKFVDSLRGFKATFQLALSLDHTYAE